jgi:quinolinate synthase
MRGKVKDLLKERKAVMLAHNYQPMEIQELADFCGDSLELSIKASQTDAEVIVFCGVHFMAETASVLSPGKIVLLPRKDAGCPMADMVTPAELKKILAGLPPMPVVTYVNSPASVKALSTICCTSANALKVVESLEEDELLMIPDRNLARNTAAQTSKRIHFWNGYCPVHDHITPEEVKKAKVNHPDAVFMAHPECRPEVVKMADAALSTSGMLRFVKASQSKSFIVGTEVGMIGPLSRENPDKNFYPVSKTMVCADMKKITVEDIIRSLELMEGEVKVPENIRRPALKAVQRMIDLSI